MNALIDKFFFVLILLITPSLILGPAIPDTIISIFSFYYLIQFILNNKYKLFFKEPWFILGILFCFGGILSSIFAYDFKIHSLSSSLPYFRFIFFCFFFNHYFSINPNKIFLLIFSISLIILFVSVDICFQYFNGIDIFGFQNSIVRNSGPFGDELKGGSFISKYFILIFSFLVFFSFKIKFFKYYSFVFATVCFFAVLFSGERSALLFFLLTFFSFLLICFFNKLKQYKFIVFIVPVLIFSSFYFLLNDNLKYRYYVTTTNDIKDLQSIFDSHYGAHYITAYNIFIDYPLLGVGQNNFRNKCSDTKYSKLNSKRISDRCATHPHNYYIQILSDLGLINFIIFLIMIFFIFYKIIQNKIHNDKFIHIGKIICCVLLFWPFFPTGSFFNNWVSSINWFLISICFVNIKDFNCTYFPFFLKNNKEII